MAKFNVGDQVVIQNDNDYWDNLEATVLGIGVHPDPQFPYHILITNNHPGAPDAVGRISDVSEGHLRLLREGTYRWGAVDRTVTEEFPDRLDVFKSELTGNAVVHTPAGDLIRILADGTVDAFRLQEPRS